MLDKETVRQIIEDYGLDNSFDENVLTKTTEYLNANGYEEEHIVQKDGEDSCLAYFVYDIIAFTS